MDSKVKTSAACSAIGVILISAGLGSGYWVLHSFSYSGDIWIGLFQTCSRYGCVQHAPFASSQEVAAAFLFLALFSMLSGALCITGLAGKVIDILKEMKVAYKYAMIANLIAVGCLTLAVVVFAGIEGGNKFGWGFFMPCVADVLAFVAAIFARNAMKALEVE